MLNQQKPLPLEGNDPSAVLLHSIFPTIQGEGIFAGHPATFVRLAGCNLKCPMCDTEYTEGSKLTQVSEIVGEVKVASSKNKLVVITGGEPFRQDLSLLIETLHSEGFTIQIETNGTMAPTYNTELPVHIMCSPKLGRIHKDLAEHISAYKYVLDHKHVDVFDGLPTRVLGLKAKPARPHEDHPRPIFLQPVDCKDEEENALHLKSTILSCLVYGYTVCLQQHKLMNLE